MFTISKKFSFSASHQLSHLPVGHQCARLHGHNYEVEVLIGASELDWRGFAGADYGELDGFKAYLLRELDHRHLNDVLDCLTTAENIARELYSQARKVCASVVAVRVSETPKTWALYAP